MRYDDPRWYEEANNQPRPNNPQAQPGQPPTQHTYEEFERYPFLPTHYQEPEDPDLIAAAERQAQFQKKLSRFLMVLALVVIAFWGGWFGNEFFNNSFNRSAESASYAKLIQEAWTKIDTNYVGRENIDYKEMSYAAINAMVETLGDPGHTRFMDPQTVQAEEKQLSGKFTGVGITLAQDPESKRIKITATIPNSPAEKANLKANDIILAINGTDVTNKSIQEIRSLIQGEVGTEVTMTIQRQGEDQPRDFQVMRAEIDVPNVYMHYIPESKTAVIQVQQFSQGVANEVRSQFEKAKEQGATSLVLDLRNNPGGYLNEAVNMVSLFVQDGTILIQQNSQGEQTPIKVNGNAIDTTTPIVVLINENSASASEIVAGSLQENNRATVIGKKTFGTGTVLRQFDLADGSALYLGVEEWLTPNGNFIRINPDEPGSGGIKPDIEVSLSEQGYILSPNEISQQKLTEQQLLEGSDNQLAEALKYLKKA